MDLTLPGARIARLPDDLVDKIAAGEVVERPASVVKELVENAIDASATSVRIEIEAGGKRLIRVRDDGTGMGAEDAARCVERHATSKLHALSELESIATHGFRGEALPSIASVSHLVLRTREASDPAGTEVEVRHGAAPVVRAVGHPVGTTVEVRDLFGSVPARRKFLKSDGTEAGHVSEAITLLALARPGVGFTLVSGGREVIRAPAVSHLGARVFQLFGADTLAELAEVEHAENGMHVAGFVTRADRARQSRGTVRLFVNGRAVRDRGLSRAITEGSRSAGAGELRGESVLLVDVPLHLVDVNVHPAKTEVRFADARTVWLAVQRAVSNALSAAARTAPVAMDRTRVGEPAPGNAPSVPVRYEQQELGGVVAERDSAVSSAASAGVAPVPFVLGQHRSIYIVASDGEELVLYDQHTSHERVRFEEVTAGLGRGGAASQGLLLPAVVTLPPRLRPVFEQVAEALGGCGYDVEPFGNDTLRVRAVPASLAGRDPGPSLVDLMRDLLDREGTDWAVAGTEHRVAATIACHSAVRAGQTLPLDAMRAIVRDLGTTEQAALCPHGRSTRVRVPKDELARWFQRTGWRRH